MNFLLRLLFFREPTGGLTVNGIDLQALSSPMMRLLLIALAVGVAAGAWRAYRHEPGWLGPGRRRLLAACRVTAGLVVLLCMTGATLDLGRSEAVSRTVAVVVDRSASMGYTDPGQAQPRWRQAMAAIASSRLLERGDGRAIRLFTVGAAAEAAAIDGGAAALAGVAPADPASRLGDGLRDVRARLQGEHVAGVILVSDGGWNRGEDPREAARTLGVPVHTLTVGQVAGADAAVAAVDCPPRVQVGDQAPVRVRLIARGLAGKTLKLSLTAGPANAPKVIGERDVPVRDRLDWVETMLWKPDKPGMVDVVASVAALPGEATTANNRATRPGVMVVDETIPVLLVDHAPRWEFRQVKGVIDREAARFKPAMVLFTVDPDLARTKELGWRATIPNRDALRIYRVIWLGDVGPADLGASAGDLDAWVREDGGGLIVSSGPRAMPGLWDGASPVGRLLPVEPAAAPTQTAAAEAERPMTASWQAVVTADGQQQPWWRIDADDTATRQRWEKAEGFYWYAANLGAKPGAVTWLAHPTLKIAGAPLPLMARHQVGRGTVLWLGVQETWRWRHQPGAAWHRRFWNQLFSDLAAADAGSERVRLESDRAVAAVGDPVLITARLRDAGGAATTLDAAEVQIEREDRPGAFSAVDRLRLPAKAGAAGEYQATWTPRAAGLHRFTAPAHESPAAARRASLIVPVTAVDLELGDPAARPELMAQIASASGGRALRLDQAGDLAGILAQAKGETRDVRKRQPLWNAPLLLLLLTTALATEWWLRTRSDLL
jgi:hypothetical protein